MVEIYIERVGKFLNTAFNILALYMVALACALPMTHVSGVKRNTLSEFVVLIIFTSILSFVATLIFHVIVQKVKFFDEIKFLRNFHGVHQLYIYISSLISLMGAFEPMLMEYGIINQPFPEYMLPSSACIFFIILSNYRIYGNVILSNELKIFKKENGKVDLTLKEVFGIISVIIGLIGGVRFIKLQDGIGFLILFVAMAPWLTIKLFKGNHSF